MASRRRSRARTTRSGPRHAAGCGQRCGGQRLPPPNIRRMAHSRISAAATTPSSRTAWISDQSTEDAASRRGCTPALCHAAHRSTRSGYSGFRRTRWPAVRIVERVLTHRVARPRRRTAALFAAPRSASPCSPAAAPTTSTAAWTPARSPSTAASTPAPPCSASRRSSSVRDGDQVTVEVAGEQLSADHRPAGHRGRRAARSPWTASPPAGLRCQVSR